MGCDHHAAEEIEGFIRRSGEGSRLCLSPRSCRVGSNWRFGSGWAVFWLAHGLDLGPALPKKWASASPIQAETLEEMTSEPDSPGGIGEPLSDRVDRAELRNSPRRLPWPLRAERREHWPPWSCSACLLYTSPSP